MRRALALPLALLLTLALIAAGCGGDDGGSDGGSSPSEAAANPGGSLTPEDGAEIEDVLKTWLTEGGCENMTDSFLEDQTFIDEPEQACQTFEDAFTVPAFSADDVIVSDIKGNGDQASAVVSDDFSNVETTFQLRNEGGDWKIDSADIN
jgi:hypothetical protein